MTDIALEPLPNPGDEGTCPFDLPSALAKWREEEPVRRISVESGGSAWLVTRHEDVRTALGDHRLSADRNRPGFPHLRADEPPMPPGTFAQYDPPEHTRIRRMLTKAFMPKNVEKLKSLIRETVDELLDAMERQPQPADLYRDFALRLPTLTMCGLLGVPYDDRAVFQENTQAILNLGLPGAEVTAAYERMLAYIGELLDAKGLAPQDDLVSELAVERVATGELTKVEAIGVIALLLISGHDTTATSISLGTIALLREPDRLRRLLAEPDTVPGAVEELLRYLPGLHTGVRRIATADLEIGGVTIRAGEGVIMALNAANRDPRVHDRADRLDFDRDRVGRSSLAWGHGIHKCLGQSLARAQLQIALPALFERFPGLRLAVPFEEIDFRDKALFFSVHKLPVAW
ncbi:cytochrome P450 [Streptomyces capitiformicae]|uniref:Cytochrome P450 n=1 Tax=Streptomyces capitiformicae TaxID=2014920 RepID=A0A918YYS3_9ACTN|nr:cytochrome P450 [Streptomyces capitiformicae]GHE29298.1 cytochrome P450 [Streptomyces capitiformicae]